MKIKFCKYHRNTFQTNLSPEYTYNPYRSPREPMALCIGKEGRKVFGASARKVKVSAANSSRTLNCGSLYFSRKSSIRGTQSTRGSILAFVYVHRVLAGCARGRKDNRWQRERERREEGGRKRQERRSVTVKQWLLPSVPLLPKHLVHVNQ